ncbi:hypothetical protein EV363DRAFT_1178253, partial [Boletus edulis]
PHSVSSGALSTALITMAISSDEEAPIQHLRTRRITKPSARLADANNDATPELRSHQTALAATIVVANTATTPSVQITADAATGITDPANLSGKYETTNTHALRYMNNTHAKSRHQHAAHPANATDQLYGPTTNTNQQNGHTDTTDTRRSTCSQPIRNSRAMTHRLPPTNKLDYNQHGPTQRTHGWHGPNGYTPVNAQCTKQVRNST